mgnify:CR=1 FL=1
MVGNVRTKQMRLYATTTSERASKGQGGNQYLITEILDKNRDKLITLHITVANSHLRGEHYNIYLTNHQSEYIDMSEQSKAKKKKGE